MFTFYDSTTAKLNIYQVFEVIFFVPCYVFNSKISHLLFPLFPLQASESNLNVSSKNFAQTIFSPDPVCSWSVFQFLVCATIFWLFDWPVFPSFLKGVFVDWGNFHDTMCFCFSLQCFTFGFVIKYSSLSGN